MSEKETAIDDQFMSAKDRIDSLSRNAVALGQAINGVGRLGPAAFSIVNSLSEQLMMISKRISWIEKTADTDWTPAPTGAFKKKVK